MYSVMMQPFFSVARANVETWLRVASTFASGMRQIGELNEKTMQSALADIRTPWGANAAESPLPALVVGLPCMAFSYVNDALSIASATATDLACAVGSDASQADANTPKLVLEDDPEASTSGETAIVDASGAVVAHVRR
ncbi:hypothetical protein AWB75_02150 [Caballeronia catudaia]|uniref:Uncharacterized protein n=1 Tax=Caballeronia catudaia TaxID=1777136 RepID=A0A158AGQ3_9BURK|nr:hypothetical protein [Caballeronia catudaia]SAK56899.1 hypothetical protein AWB75_02150 [Caballeronia catudaia]